MYFDVPATEGCKNFPLIIFQCHVDMVCTSNDGQANFKTEPINLVYDEKIHGIHSKDYYTNIGADDAQGIISCMALACNKNYRHGPLRMLFTYDEETTMQGSSDVSTQVLDGNFLISIDGGPVGSACIASGGCFDGKFCRTFVLNSYNNKYLVKIKIDNLLGGHSGIKIQENRLNANNVVIKILNELIVNNIEFNLVKIAGGCVTSAIADCSNFNMLINKNDAANVKKVISNKFNDLKNNSDDKDNAKLNIDFVNADSIKALDKSCSKQLINFLKELPFGVLEMNKDFPEKPSVSANIPILKLADGVFSVLVGVRFSKRGIDEKFNIIFSNLSKKHNINYSIFSFNDCWEQSDNMALTNLWLESYKKACNFEGAYFPTHAGLECAEYLKKNPNLNMLSVGMDVAEEHTVKETLYTKSMVPFFAGLLEFLENADKLSI